jgi:hypothetical protein
MVVHGYNQHGDSELCSGAKTWRQAGINLLTLDPIAALLTIATAYAAGTNTLYPIPAWAAIVWSLAVLVRECHISCVASLPVQRICPSHGCLIQRHCSASFPLI